MAEELAHHLRQAGYKLTPPRWAVLRVLEASGDHLNHAQVLARAQTIYPALGRATVYRTLEILTSLGVLRPIHLGTRGICFARTDRGHHHLLCSDCGTVIEFEQCMVSEVEGDLAHRFDFEIKGHLLELYGLCQQCRVPNGHGCQPAAGAASGKAVA